jgi:hypothetical protein
MLLEAWNNEKQSTAVSLIDLAADAWGFAVSQLSPVDDWLSTVSFRADCGSSACKMFPSKLPMLLSMLSLGSQAQLSARQSTNATAPLVNFQVAQPPITPKLAQSCTVELFRHTFANSYYHPEIVEYTVRLARVLVSSKLILFARVI